MLVTYHPDAAEKVGAAISEVNRTGESADVVVGTYEDGSSAAVHLAVGDIPEEFDDDESEAAQEGRAPLYFSLLDGSGDEVSGGQWDTVLTQDNVPMPKPEADALAKELLEECSSQL